MMKYPFLFVFFLLGQSSFAQLKLPVIKAASKNVAINDGGYLDKNAWVLSPRIKPDIFTADRTRKAKWVIFYTDIDSIKVKVTPGTKFSFIVLLNGLDSCFTQIASALPAETNTTNKKATHDTIPFVLTAYNAIHVKSVFNNRDTLNLHFDVGSFDFHLTRDAILTKTKLLSNQPDALAGKAKPNYNNLEKVLKIQIGNLIWENPSVIPTGLSAHEMDGRFGANLFEGRVVEIDYENSLLIIHSRLPENMHGYSKSRMEFIRSFLCIKGALQIQSKKYEGRFMFDTGSDQAMILDSSWVSKQRFPKDDLQLIKSSIFRDPRNVKYETRIVRCPLLKINKLSLTNIPTYLLGTKNPVDFEINYFGNDLLKRFNTILDFKNDVIYLKPNKLMNLPFRENS